MVYISHRGNLNGKIEFLENSPSYIDLAISKGFDVEIDVWLIENIIYLGHDKPQYIIDINWLIERKLRIWVHCKNLESLEFFYEYNKTFNFFWHENDTVTITSYGYIWAYPGNQPIKNSIAVMPEINDENINLCVGICSDKIEEYFLSE